MLHAPCCLHAPCVGIETGEDNDPKIVQLQQENAELKLKLSKVIVELDELKHSVSTPFGYMYLKNMKPVTDCVYTTLALQRLKHLNGCVQC